MVTTIKILGGIGLIIFGCYVINDTYKNPNKTFWSSNLKGYGAGVGFIILGIVYTLRNLQNINW